MFYLDTTDIPYLNLNWFRLEVNRTDNITKNYRTSIFSRWDNKPIIYASDSLQEIEDICKKVSAPYEFTTLEDTDKTICFKNSSFPSLLLSRLKENYPEIKWKRTTKEVDADKIVSDNEESRFYNVFNFGIRVYGKIPTKDGKFILYISNPSFGAWYKTDKFKELDKDNYIELQKIVKEMETIDPNIEIFYGCALQSKEALDQELFRRQNSYKIVKTETFIRKLWEIIPPISDSEFDTIRKYLKSDNYDNQNIGLQSLQYTNFKERIPELIKIFEANLGGVNNAAATMVRYLMLWKEIGNRYNSVRLWYEKSVNSDLYTQQEKDNRVNIQIKNLMATLIATNINALNTLKVHVAAKGFDGSIKTIKQYC